jgi:hypothetical protein
MKKFNIRTINIINIFLSIAFLVTLGARFYYSDKVSIAGTHLREYEQELSSYQKQNEFLKNQYLTLTSLSVIKPLALENGYVEANVEYYTSPDLAVR